MKKYNIFMLEILCENIAEYRYKNIIVFRKVIYFIHLSNYLWLI